MADAEGAAAAPARENWGNSIQFLLTAIGYAVGLGNVWRFPMLAFENGGGSFLIPYVTCVILFGLPTVFMEMTVSQYTQCGPSGVFKKYAPLFQGLGWSMCLSSLLVSIFYNVLISWCSMYLFNIVTGQWTNFASCNNTWASDYCTSVYDDAICYGRNNATPYFFRGNCSSMTPQEHVKDNSSLTVAANDFFFYNILHLNKTVFAEGEQVMEQVFGAFHWQPALSLLFVWTLTALCIMYGVKVMGSIAYLTSTLPYVIIAVLFVRGVTLNGAGKGINEYFTPHFDNLLKIGTWKAAASQVCFSLSIGVGGLLALASYNKREHNSYRDALIIAGADSFMSIFGGCAVFSILGYLSTVSGSDIKDVVQTGAALLYVVYPQAMTQMSLPWLWCFFFFLIIFLLGISSQFGMCEVVVTSICDQFPQLRRHQKLVVIGLCASCFLVGLTTCTSSGYFWFSLFAHSAGGGIVIFCAFLELVVVCWIYGFTNHFRDIRSMWGEPKGWLGKILGPTGWYFAIEWLILAPVATLVMSLVMLYDELFGERFTEFGAGFPTWIYVISCCLIVSPIVPLLIFAAINISQVFRSKKTWKMLVQISPTHPSYNRARADQIAALDLTFKPDTRTFDNAPTRPVSAEETTWEDAVENGVKPSTEGTAL